MMYWLWSIKEHTDSSDKLVVFYSRFVDPVCITQEAIMDKIESIELHVGHIVGVVVTPIIEQVVHQ